MTVLQVRARHILFRHQQLKQPDPMARREGAALSTQEAEEAALKAAAGGPVRRSVNLSFGGCRYRRRLGGGRRGGSLPGLLR